jgi:uncharacterized protein YjbJ (UPF0337 family)
MMCPRFDWNLTIQPHWLAAGRFAKQACTAGLGRSVVRAAPHWSTHGRAHDLLLVEAFVTLPETAMNSDQTTGAWHQIKGKVKEQWGKLTDDDLTQIEGKSEQLAGKLQERYGMARDEAERQATDFCNRNNWH